VRWDECGRMQSWFNSIPPGYLYGLKTATKCLRNVKKNGPVFSEEPHHWGICGSYGIAPSIRPLRIWRGKWLLSVPGETTSCTLGWASETGRTSWRTEMSPDAVGNWTKIPSHPGRSL